MNEQTPPMPGYAISSIALTAGLGFIDAALGVAAVLGGTAGPKACFTGPAGEAIHPGINLVVAGSDSPRWLRAQDLLLTPLEMLQATFRDISRAADPERLDYLQSCRHQSERTDVIVAEASRSFLEDGLEATGQYVDRKFDVVQRPNLLLRSPDFDAFTKAEVLDGWPFVYYPDGLLFTELLRRRPGKNWGALGKALSSAIAGQDQSVTGDRRGAPGRIEMRKTHFLTTCSNAELRAALIADRPELQRILRNSVILDPAVPAAVEGEINYEELRRAYRGFHDSIRKVFDARRLGVTAGIQWGTQRDKAGLHALTMEIYDWQAGLPESLRPYFGFASTLPYKIRWACVSSLCPGESEEWIPSFTRYASLEILRR